MAGEPGVSICIPTYNGARWITEAVESALRQTWSDFELLVVDDGSTDGTLDLLARVTDLRLRIERGGSNVGPVANWNRCARLARGEFVKFLFQDDLLYPTCLERMVQALRLHPTAGLVFSRREILLQEPDDPRSRAWKEQYGTLHTQFERIETFNRGGDLFEQYRRKGFRMNFVGEPTAVMARRSCFDRVGLFNTRMHQGADFELWSRLFFFYDAVFLDEPLVAFRVHAASTSRENDRTNRPWLDMLWLLEGLLQHPEIRQRHPELGRLRWLEAARIARAEVRRLLRGRPSSPAFLARSLGAYCAYRVRSLRGRAPGLHG